MKGEMRRLKFDVRYAYYSASRRFSSNSGSFNSVTKPNTQHSSGSNMNRREFLWFKELHRRLFSVSSRAHKTSDLKSLSSNLGSVMAAAAGLGIFVAKMPVAVSEVSTNENAACNASCREHSSDNNMDIEQLVRRERMKVEEQLKKIGGPSDAVPPFTVAAKGQQVAIRFQLPPGCDLYQLILDVAAHLGSKVNESGGGSEMILRAWDSAVARQLILMQPDKYLWKNSEIDRKTNKKEILTEKAHEDDDVCILIFEPLINSSNAEIEFLKKGSFSAKELNAIILALRAAGNNRNVRRHAQKQQRDGLKARERKEIVPNIPSNGRAIKALEDLGVKIYGLKEHVESSPENDISWENIAGYHEQKREIEDTILLALRCPEIYDSIAKGTRSKFESNRPRAILFEGPPGTGKTSCARVIASQAGVPLLYVPLEVIMSKFYGESERLLGSIFNLANELPEGALIFLDEIDAIAIARGNEMNEATRRILSVLLRQIDGFEQEKRVVVIAATNRWQDLDPALISRFDSSIRFDLPDYETRQEIAAQYARHLNKMELETLAHLTEGMSGRDLRDICQQAERRWASKLIRGQVGEKTVVGLPPIHEYIESAKKRQQNILKWQHDDKSGLEDQNHAEPQMQKWKSVVV